MSTKLEEAIQALYRKLSDVERLAIRENETELQSVCAKQWKLLETIAPVKV